MSVANVLLFHEQVKVDLHPLGLHAEALEALSEGRGLLVEMIQLGLNFGDLADDLRLQAVDLLLDVVDLVDPRPCATARRCTRR